MVRKPNAFAKRLKKSNTRKRAETQHKKRPDAATSAIPPETVGDLPPVEDELDDDAAERLEMERIRGIAAAAPDLAASNPDLRVRKDGQLTVLPPAPPPVIQKRHNTVVADPEAEIQRQLQGLDGEERRERERLLRGHSEAGHASAGLNTEGDAAYTIQPGEQGYRPRDGSATHGTKQMLAERYENDPGLASLADVDPSELFHRQADAARTRIQSAPPKPQPPPPPAPQPQQRDTRTLATQSPASIPAVARPRSMGSAPVTTVMVDVPTELLDVYAAQAADVDASLASFLGERLRRCATHTSPSGLYVSDELRQELGRMLNSSLMDVSDLQRSVRGLCTIRVKVVGGVDVTEAPIDVTIDRQTWDNIRMAVHSGISFEQRVRQFAIAGLRNPH